MKKIIIMIFLFSFSLLHISCSDWLDVDPKTEVKEEDLFDDEEGFKDALIGLYIVLKSESLYGKNMILTTMEYLAQHWTVSNSQSSDYRLSDYDYEADNVKSIFSSIYGQSYYDIIQANNIINNAEEKKNVFTGVNYDLIKGEALGIRAFLHFDLLRLFGPVPEYGNQVSTVLPYVKTLSISYHPHVNYQTYIRLLEEDILESLDHLKTFDPLLFRDVAYNDYNNPNLDREDEFLAGRSQRINYYAMKGLQARFYLWIGKNAEAYECAAEIINAKTSEGNPIFPLGTLSEMSGGDKTLTSEHLLSIHVYNLADIANSLFNSDNAIEKRETEIKNDLFPGTTTDIRLNNLWKKLIVGNGTEKFVITKYDQSSSAKKSFL
ncbi:MAG: RagB/SusD family nutrient uptake outer membrane protein [Odoribacter sp.]|nr:RagB/SusD family nutrient uptake outer membrane protein [Odoribacter sp.]